MGALEFKSLSVCPFPIFPFACVRVGDEGSRRSLGPHLPVVSSFWVSIWRRIFKVVVSKWQVSFPHRRHLHERLAPVAGALRFCALILGPPTPVGHGELDRVFSTVQPVKHQFWDS